MMFEKPTFNTDQITSSSEAAKKFGELRKKAKMAPQFITDNGTVDTVVMDYEYYEKMYIRLQELEEIEETTILSQRMERLENNPGASVAWKSVRRSGNVNE